MTVVTLALGVEVAGQQSSFAGQCGEYCEARHVRAICEEAVTKRDLKGRRGDVEFRKCQARLMNSESQDEKARDVKSSSD
jgi:hypothetical protein